MNGKTDQEIIRQAETRRRGRGRHGHPPLRSRFTRVSHLIGQCCSPTLRHCEPVQHPKQWRFAGVFPAHVRETRLDIRRRAKQGQKGTCGAFADLPDRAGATAEQGELVRDYVGGAGCHRWLGHIGASLAKRGVSALDATGQNAKTGSSGKKINCPYTGLSDRRISPYNGLGVIRIGPYTGPLQRIFRGRPSPYTGHLLDNHSIGVLFRGDLGVLKVSGPSAASIQQDFCS